MSVRLISSAPSSAAAYREGLIARFVAANDFAIELHLLAEAADYDRANPGAALVDELLGASVGDAA